MSDPAGLDSASEFIRLSTGFAAGSLVFSVGLIGSAPSLSNSGRIFLFVAWIALFAAMVAGVIASSRIPVKKAQKNYDLEDKFLTTPTRVHQFAFASGVICLGITLLLTLFNEPPLNVHSIATAAKALAMAEGCVPRGTIIRKLSVVESIKAADATRPSLMTWHIQFETIPQNATGGRFSGKTALPRSTVVAPPSAYLDVFVDAHSGVTTSLGRSSCPDAADIYKRK
jgi:hypothetical protein